MDRNREAWRGSMAALNGGLSRRRQQRSTNLRDSPEEDGVMEMQESSRLRDRDRDRGIKKDRDRDRSGGGSGRSKRRRGERPVHGSNRDDGDESSEESLDEDDEEEDDAPVSVRFPPPPPPTLSTQTNPIPSSSSSSLQQLQQQSQSNHVRKSISSSKPARPPAPSWKVAEEMIGVSIPRKARSSSLKRTQECGGGGSGELIHRQASTSPTRPSPSSNTAISPSSSNVSVRKKKPISGSKHRPPKISKSSIQEIEIEVAEVLYGMTRQAPAPPVPPSSSARQDANGLSNEAKSRVSSPGSFSPVPATSQASVLPGPNLNSSYNNSAPLVTTAPKRKRPRLKLEDESPTSPVAKPETEPPPKLEEGSAPASPSRSEKKTAAAAASPAVDNGGTALTEAGTVAGGDHMQEPTKQESSSHVPEQKEAKEEIALATTSKSKEVPCSKSNANLDEATVIKDGSAVPMAESPREEKFSIDLMAPPPPAPTGNSERDCSLDCAVDHKPIEPVKEMRPDTANGEMEKPDRSSKQQEATEAASAENTGSSKHDAKEKPTLDLRLDLEKQNKDGLSLGGGGGKHQQQMKPQPKAPRIDPKPEKKAQSTASLPLTMPIAGWPGGFPHFGYMGQVPALPAVMPMDGNSAAAKTLQAPHFFPPQKPKRCATHCYIAQTIHYNQQIARMNSIWPPAAAAAAVAAAAVGTPPIYGAKQHNLNLVPPPSEAAILGNPLQGSFPGRNLGPLQEKASPTVAMTYTGPPAKEKSSAAATAANNTLIEAQRKQFLLQQAPQPGSSAAPPSMLHGPAFIFPISQQPAAAAAAVAAAATRSITAKSTTTTPGIGNATPSAASGSSAAAGSGPSSHSTTTMSFNYPGLQPNDTQYLAFLQNNGYPFPIPAHVGGGPSPYRGANPSQAMPFLNGSFYSSPILHPPSQHQFRQQQQPPAHSQQGHQNTSTSSGSSSSQKHHPQQQQRVPGGAAAAGATPAGGSSHNFSAKQHLHLLPPQARQLESEAAGCEDSPSTADSSRVSQAQKSIYGNFAMSIHPQNFALISPAAVPSSGGGGGGGGGSHNEKPQPVHNQASLTPSQAYAMSFAPFGGPAAAGGAAQGLDFSSMVQNHALFHSLPEAARHHGYQQITAVAAAAAAAQAAQHKKSRHEDGKSVGDPGAVGANVACEEGKMMASAGKSPGGVGVAQHSLSFSRPDNNDTQTSTILGNSSSITEGSSRTLNLIQPPANGGRASNRPSSAAPASNSPVANTANTASNLHMQSSQQQQQHLIQLQKSQQHQQQLHLQQQMSSRPTKGSSHGSNNAPIYSDRMPAGSMSRFSQGALAGLPPSNQSASATQSPQWKASGRAATSGPANSATSSSSSAKNQVPQQQQQQQQQQARNQQQHQQALLGSNMHQTQISFGVSSSKAVGVSGQTHLAGGSGNSPLASAAAAAIAAGSPQSAVSKSSAGNGGGGSSSPRGSSTSKSGPPPPTLLSPALPLHQQTPAGKNSPSSSSSNLKSSSPANNRNMTSILGHPQTNSSSSTKFQQQSQQQQQQQKQSFHQPQLFFSNPYLQAAQSSQPNVAAAAANFYQQQRRQSEQQAHQHSQQSQQQNSTNSGVLSLCPSSLTLAGSSPTSDPAKAASAVAAAAGVMKGLAPAPGAAGGGILQHNAQYAAAASSMGQHPLMSSSFPYIQTMSSSVSVKPAGDQKAAPGSENLHWKPEKR